MNSILIKGVMGFLGVFFFSILVLYSFEKEPSEMIHPLSDIHISKGVFYHTNNTKIKKGEGIDKPLSTIFVEENIDIFSTIYSENKNYSFSGGTSGGINIVMGTGAFLFDFKNTFQSLYINGGTYEIILEDGGMVYVENFKNRIMIASFNTSIVVNFIDENTKKINSQSYLYPHMYLGFNRQRFKVSKNLDSLRVDQLGRLGFFDHNFSEIIEGKSEVFISESQDLLFNVLPKIIKQSELYSGLYLKYKKLNIKQFSGLELLEKYRMLLYNPQKKVIYYKHKVFSNSILMLGETKDYILLQDTIIESLEEIGKISTAEYKNILKMVENFYFLSLNETNKGSNVSYNNFHRLLTQINNKSLNSNKTNLYTHFNALNFHFPQNIYTQLSKTYSNTNIFGEKNSLQYEYYLFFIKHNLIFGFNSDLEDQYYNSLIELLGLYAQDLQSIQYIDNQEARVMTNILYNKEILGSIIDSIQKKYFNGRNEQNLLVIGTKVFYNVNGFQKSITNLLKYYGSGKEYLVNNQLKYSNIISEYTFFDTQLKEYIQALHNYSLYQKEYSKINQKLLEVDIFKENREITLSKEIFVDFIKKFSGINSSRLDITIIDQNFYKITGLSVGGKVFSFNLYPFQDNRISDIVLLNNTIKPGTNEYLFYYNLVSASYDLDREEIKYKKSAGKGTDNDSGKYEFKNFFINNFLPSQSSNAILYKDTPNNAEIDDVIHVFKTAKLLGDKGEFNLLKGKLIVNYDNIEVEKIGQNFSIHLKNTTFHTKITKNGQTSEFYIEVNSDYRLDKQNHSFYNIRLRPYSKLGNQQNKYLFGRHKIEVQGEIPLQSFNESMVDFIRSSSLFEYDLLQQGKNITDMIYNPAIRELIDKN